MAKSFKFNSGSCKTAGFLCRSFTRALLIDFKGIHRNSGAEQAAVKWGPLSAWAIVIIAPIVVFTFAVNRLMVQGLRGGIAEE